MYFVGIDSGGTKCEVVICDEEANIVGYSYNEANYTELKKNLDPYKAKFGYGRSLKIIRRTFDEACKDLDMSQIFIINCDFGDGNRAFFDVDFKYEFEYCSEYSAITGATNIDYAYVVLSGTGAFVTYRSENEDFYFDGMGPNLGDYGGGYSIGLEAAKATAISEWDDANKTSIAPKINKKMIGQETNNYGKCLAITFLKLIGRTEIASFSRIVNEEAENGDKIAIRILKNAGEALGYTVRCLVNNVRPNPKNFPLLCDGSVIKKCRIYREAFIEYCKKYVPNNKVIFSPMPQAFGAVMISVKIKKPEIKDDYYNKLLKNYNNLKN